MTYPKEDQEANAAMFSKIGRGDKVSLTITAVSTTFVVQGLFGYQFGV